MLNREIIESVEKDIPKLRSDLADNVQQINAKFSQVETKKANVSEVIKKGYGTLNDFDETTRNAIAGGDYNLNYVLGGNNAQYNNLSQPLQEQIGEKINITDYTRLNGFIDYRDGSYTENGAYYSTKIDVKQGDILYCTTKCESTVLAIAVFYNDNNVVIGNIGGGILQEYIDKSFTIPNNVYKVAFCWKREYPFKLSKIVPKVFMPMLEKNIIDFNNYKSEIDKAFTSFIQIDTIPQKGFIDFRNGIITPNDNYTSIIQPCNAGDKYRTTVNVSAPVTAKVVFYRSDNTVLSAIDGGIIGEFKDYEFVVPQNCSALGITTRGTSAPPLSKFKDTDYEIIRSTNYKVDQLSKKIESSIGGLIYVSKNNSNIIVNSKYSDSKDFQVTFSPIGVNNILQFDKFSTINNTEKEVSSKETFDTNILSNGTDWFSPHVLKAVNNANGDYIGSNIPFTGGIHGYGGATSYDVSSTGRTANIKLKVNGGIVNDNFKGYADFIEIEWDNFIQGANTQLLIGGGREIIKEHIKLKFDGHTWEVENTITALEDIQYQRLYGLQSYNYGGYSGQINYKGSNVNRGKYDTKLSSDSGDKRCRDIKIIGNSNCIEFGILDYGIGNFNYSTVNYSCFETTAQKSYFCLIFNDNYSFNLKANDEIFFKGYYKFYSKLS